MRSFTLFEASGALYIHSRSILWFGVLTDIQIDLVKPLRIMFVSNFISSYKVQGTCKTNTPMFGFSVAEIKLIVLDV